jgi:predicted O-methyltransferase YrrM
MDELDYIHPPPMLDRIVARTKALDFDMASEPKTGALLRSLAASKPRGTFLELGTGTGVATSWLLDGMDAHSQLTSVDTNAQVQAVAREFLGADNRLTLVLEDGLQFLNRQKPESYDFVFADAVPGKWDGLRDCLRVVKPGGFYVVDDILSQASRPDGFPDKVPVLMNALASDENFAIVPMSWATGIVVAVRRK